VENSPLGGTQPTIHPDDDERNTIVARATYQLFMVLVTLLALAIAFGYYLLPLPETVDQVLYIVESFISVILLYDFFAHVFSGRGRVRYLLTYGWLDLLGALPVIPALRLARIPGLIVMLRELRETTPKHARMAARQRLAESTLLTVVLVVLLVVTAGSILIVLIEAPLEHANIKTGEDAVWWALVSIATVGYGDKFPVTSEGRLIGAALIVMGVGLFSVQTSYIATQFMARRKRTGVSEVEVLRQEMHAAFAASQHRAAAENAALRDEMAALRRLLASLPAATAPDRAEEAAAVPAPVPLSPPEADDMTGLGQVD
jgi:voltage-gated potassium channel